MIIRAQKLIAEELKEKTGTLKLFNCELTAFPVEVRNMNWLEELDLRYNQLTQIPTEIGQLNKLTSLDLSYNQLTQIPTEIINHIALEYVGLTGNTIKNIPDEILAGTKWKHFNNNALPDIRQWFAELAKGSIPNYQFKLLILGNGRVGKSCIVDALQGREFDDHKKSSHAIQLEQWSPPPIPNIPKLEYFIWDFGGQEIFHSTHRWFMRSRAVYLVVWDRTSEALGRIYDDESKREYDNHTLPYWINTIRSKNPDIPILVVENKLDAYGHRRETLSESELPKKYRIGLEFASFSARERKALYLNLLLPDIQFITESMDEYGQEMPLSWSNLRERILNCIFTDSGEPTHQRLTMNEFHQWCEEAEVLPKSGPSLLRFLHRTGIVYTDEKLLGDTILLDQQWAVEAIYKVLDRNSDFFVDTIEDRKGKFRQRHLFKEWNDNYSNTDKQLFLQFMVSCNLCFPIDENDESKNAVYAIPQLMPENSPQHVRDIWKYNLPNVHYLEFQYDFLHYASVQDFIVRMGRKTKLEYIWKNGIAIPWQDSQALVIANVPEKIIHVRTMGSHRSYLMSAIRNAFQSQVDKDKTSNIQISNDGLYFVDLKDLAEQKITNNQNIRATNRKTLEKENFPISLFEWALQREEKADLKQLPDKVQVVSINSPEVPVAEEEPFIISSKPVKVIETRRIETIYSDEDTTQKLDSLQKTVLNHYTMGKEHYALSKENNSLGNQNLIATFDNWLLLLNLSADSKAAFQDITQELSSTKEQLFHSQAQETAFFQKAESYFQELPPAQQQKLQGWQNGELKHKIKVALPLFFVKYEAEMELKKLTLPKTWKAFKELFVIESE